MANVKVKQYDGMMDRRAATAAITSTEFLSGVAPQFNAELIEGDLLKTVLSWCVDYFEKHGQAPNRGIQDIFASKYDTLDPDLADDIGEFLESLSREYESQGEDINAAYMLDQFTKQLRLASLRKMSERIQIAVEAGDLEEAEEVQSEFQQVSSPTIRIIDPLTDETAITHAFEHQAQPLYKMPGRLGRMINQQLTRDSLVAFLGREKIGKTWQLMEHAKRAMRAGKKVLMIQAGDMSEKQQVLRFAVSVAGRSNLAGNCGDIRVPVLDCWWNQTGECDLKHRPDNDAVIEDAENPDNPLYVPWDEIEAFKPCTYCKNRKPRNFQGAPWWKEIHVEQLNAKDAYRITSRFSKASGGSIRLVCQPTGTLNVKGIEGILRRLEFEEGFIPQVIIIDYADILAPEQPRNEQRRIENDRWEAMRRLSQVWQALVLTATQADTKSYKKWLLTMDNFSESKTKLAHCTAMFGLNQMSFEKKRNIMRINEVVVREADYDVSSWVTVLQSLKTGRPYIASY